MIVANAIDVVAAGAVAVGGVVAEVLVRINQLKAQAVPWRSELDTVLRYMRAVRGAPRRKFWRFSLKFAPSWQAVDRPQIEYFASNCLSNRSSRGHRPAAARAAGAPAAPHSGRAPAGGGGSPSRPRVRAAAAARRRLASPSRARHRHSRRRRRRRRRRSRRAEAAEHAREQLRVSRRSRAARRGGRRWPAAAARATEAGGP